MSERVVPDLPSVNDTDTGMLVADEGLGGHADARGYSYADAYLRQDEGAIVGPAFVAGAIGPGGWASHIIG